MSVYNDIGILDIDKNGVHIMQNDWIIPLVSIVVGGLAGFGGAALKLGRYAQMVEDLRTRTDNSEKEVKELTKQLTACATKIDERTQSAASSLVKRKSPISLSEMGEDLLKKSGADKFVLENQSELVEKIRKENPSTAYDVQEAAKRVVSSLVDDEKVIPLKNYAFKEGLELNNIFLVTAIYLRDIALPLLNFKPEDIDLSDPEHTTK